MPCSIIWSEQAGRTELDLTEDLYWNIPEKHLYSVYTPPLRTGT